MDILAKQLPYLLSDSVLSSWHFSNMFSIIDSKESFLLLCSISDFSGMEKRKDCIINSVAFSDGSTSPWPQTEITKASHHRRAARQFCELNLKDHC